jgi:hypothetical protein
VLECALTLARDLAYIWPRCPHPILSVCNSSIRTNGRDSLNSWAVTASFRGSIFNESIITPNEQTNNGFITVQYPLTNNGFITLILP